jgi:UDP-N-acetylmuramate dehydrogenase
MVQRKLFPLLNPKVKYYTTAMLSLPNLKQNEPLASYTTYKIGGPADYFVSVKTKEELAEAIRSAKAESLPYFILGCGANILVRDKGIRGLVIHNEAKNVTFEANYKLIAESGAIVADLIEETRDRGWSGLEHFVGIPSTVGGAMWQNLHFLDPERTDTLYIASLVDSAEILDQNQSITIVKSDFFQFGYDDSVLHRKPVVVLSVSFSLSPKDPTLIQKQMDENMRWRREKQPQLDEYPSCGSVFKKIEGVGAGRLIDRAGLKGTRIGNAMISEKHANYIVNLGAATAADVIDLIKLAQIEVKRKFGYELEPEISIIGEK